MDEKNEKNEKQELINNLKYIIGLAEKNEYQKIIDFTRSMILQINLREENVAEEYVEKLLKELN